VSPTSKTGKTPTSDGRTGAPELHLVRGSGRARDLSDLEIVGGLLERARWAEEAVWLKHAPTIYRFLYRALGSAADAEDRTQEVFLCLYSKIDQLRRPDALRSFLFASAVRLIRWELRRRRVRRWVTLSDTGEPPDGHVPETDHLARSALRRFYAMLDTFSAHERTIFVLRHMEGFTLEEVSETMGISLATTKRHLAKAAERFSTKVADEPDLQSYLAQRRGRDAI
jgi:RNA polymerase sigma-70 factor, ECF subfamily